MSDVRACFRCARPEQTDKCLIDSYACHSCINAQIRYYYPQVKQIILGEGWKCLCGHEQARGVTVHKFLLCKDKLACKCRTQEHSPWPKLSFLQQFDPSPLSSDFTGDVSIVINDSDECIQAHRFVLAGRSPVFKTMMEIDMKEKLSGVVQIGGMSAATVRAAVNFMYTGDVEFSDEVRAEDMVRFADQYEVCLLKDVCEGQLVKKISSENLLEMLSICFRFRTEKLKKVAMKYFTDHPDVHESILHSVFTTP